MLNSAIAYPGLMALLFGGAFLFGTGLFLLALQYHRFGRLTLGRTLATGATVIYVFAVGAYTMLPLPSSRAASCEVRTGGLALDPMGPINDLRLATAAGLSGALHSSLFWQLALNVLLFIPFGILAVRWLGLHPLTAIAFGAFSSLAIETLQYTGLFGLFCSYRVADVGDIMTNTLGTVLGVLLALTPLFGWIRTPRQLEATARRMPLTRVRRLWGMVFDLAFVGATGTLGAGLMTLSEDSLVTGAGYHLDTTLWWVGVTAPLWVTVIPVLGARRSSLGQRCVWLDSARLDGTRAPIPLALLQALLGAGGYAVLACIAAAHGGDGPGWISTVSGLWVLVNGVVLLFDRGARGFSYRLAALTPLPRGA